MDEVKVVDEQLESNRDVKVSESVKIQTKSSNFSIDSLLSKNKSKSDNGSVGENKEQFRFGDGENNDRPVSSGSYSQINGGNDVLCVNSENFSKDSDDVVSTSGEYFQRSYNGG